MAYKDFYSRLPGVQSTYNDGSLASLQVRNNAFPKILVAAAAEKGFTNRIYNVETLDAVIREFGEYSDVSNAIQLVQSNGARNVDLVKVGSKESHLLITKKLSSSSFESEIVIKITPKRQGKVSLDNSDVNVFKSYKLALIPFKKGNLYKQRILLLQSVSSRLQDVIIYDSEMLLAKNLGDFDIEINNEIGVKNILFTPGILEANAAKTVNDVILDIGNSKLNTTNLKTLFDLDTDSIHVFPDATNVSAAIDTDSYSVSLIDNNLQSVSEIDNNQRYAGLEAKINDLDYYEADMIYVDGAYADVGPVDLSVLSLEEQVEYSLTHLGYMWKYVYEGKPYIFMFGNKEPFSEKNVRASATLATANQTTTLSNFHSVKLILTPKQRELGDLLNLVKVFVHKDAAVPATKIETFPTHEGFYEIHITLANLTVAANTSFVTPFFTLTTKAAGDTVFVDGEGYRVRPSFIHLDSDSDDARELSIFLESNGTNTDPFVLTPYDLLGYLIPEAVLDRLFSLSDDKSSVNLIASNDEVREVNFLHQAAYMAYKASNTTSQTIAFVPTLPPPASNDGLRKWTGASPEYSISDSGDIEIIASGTGIQGIKTLFGSPSYRQGLPFGGVILTTGASLPNQEPYGIDDQDEAVDEKGLPIDLGKHAIVVGSWGTINSQLITGNRLRVLNASNGFINLAPAIMAKLTTLPVNEEPIGPVNGLVAGVSTLGLNIPKATLNNLALGRVCMFDQNGALSVLRTAALPSSDYTRVSTIRCSNRILNNVRSIALPFIGKAFAFTKASIQQRIDGFMASEVKLGNIQSYNPPVIRASRADEIAGRMFISVSFVPPFSLETVNVDLTILPPA
jgi:hypothetical protein